jgi:hypothetical protein
MNEQAVAPVNEVQAHLATLCDPQALEQMEGGEALPMVFGTFYRDLLQTYKRADVPADEKQRQIQEAAAALPEPLQAVYGGIADALHEQFAGNRALLTLPDTATDTEKIAFFLRKSSEMYYDEDTNDRVPEDVVAEVLADLSYGDMSLREPTEGLFIVDLGQTAQAELTEMGLLTEGTRAQYVNRQDTSPGYLLVPKKYPDETSTPELIEEHEEQHFIRDHLARAGLTVQPNEQDPAMAAAVSEYSDEVGAYTLSHNGITTIKTWNMVPKTGVESVYKRVDQSKMLVGLAMELAKAEGGTVTPFLAVSLHARSFAELEANAVAQIPPELTAHSLEAIVRLAYAHQITLETVQAAIGPLGQRVPLAEQRAFAENNLADCDQPQILLQSLNGLADFFTQLGEPMPLTDDAIQDRLRALISLPDTTLRLLPQLYASDRYFAREIAPFLDHQSVEQLFVEHMNLSDLVRGQAASWLTLIGSSPELKQAFARAKPQIIAKEQAYLADMITRMPEPSVRYIQENSDQQLAAFESLAAQLA